MSRAGERSRSTRETTIRARIDLDGTGQAAVRTGVGFFDHMLDALARHGMFDIDVECTGDLHIDAHHTVEDVGIVLGGAFLDALGDKRGIVRYADATVPLDEALTRAVVDVSGRPFIHYDVPLPAGQPMIGQFDAALAAEFWRAFAMEARITLHLDGLRGDNAHHVVEATFKAAARALDAATMIDPRRADVVPSTKGAL
ncbi:imidazoleglycerol-phosphate dehydratase HisB [Longimicrobium sp.]|uniref:imidazoleglycerol-phosphate dehydratase HisB n=1 Tax=Longimicrobium sp. TaxID=2029185 RepID=UPI002E37CED1|nr:imidazoleglycerol-phosphate dehydratase HisB [Longimicrobium sp.]HEX6042328.1 imidazoleglycerol-phosphate dehydratase HisB [Longimicrobium sp.]